MQKKILLKKSYETYYFQVEKYFIAIPSLSESYSEIKENLETFPETSGLR